MGVGISYTGFDGSTKRANVSGVDEAKSILGDAARLSRASTSDAEKMLDFARRPKAHMDMFRDGEGEAKFLPGGSVVKSEGGMCLRGEEISPLVEGKKMFASVNGRKGFFSIDEIDPPERGTVVGVGDRRTQTTPDSGSKDEPDGRPWTVTVNSRITMREDEASKLIVITEFYKEMYFSAEGRVLGVSGEKSRIVGSFVKATGTGTGRYGVRVFTNQDGFITHLLFGDDNLLDGDNEAEIAQREGVVQAIVSACPTIL